MNAIRLIVTFRFVSSLRACRPIYTAYRAASTRVFDKMASSGSKSIVVFGATGNQGGSVVRALKDDKQFHVKAATRNPDSDKAKALADSGFEVVKADLDDGNEVRRALQGAHGVFFISNEHSDTSRMIQQVKNVADASKDFAVQHLVYSGPVLNEKVPLRYESKYLEAQSTALKYIEQNGVPVTTVSSASYFENFLTRYVPKKNDKDEYVLEIPMEGKPMEMIAVSEIGECIREIFCRPDEFKGQSVGLCAQISTIDEYAAILSTVIGNKRFVAGKRTADEYGNLGFPGAKNIATMFKMMQDGNFAFDVDLTRRLNPNISTFEQWVEKNRQRLESVLQ